MQALGTQSPARAPPPPPPLQRRGIIDAPPPPWVPRVERANAACALAPPLPPSLLPFLSSAATAARSLSASSPPRTDRGEAFAGGEAVPEEEGEEERPLPALEQRAVAGEEAAVSSRMQGRASSSPAGEDGREAVACQ